MVTDTDEAELAQAHIHMSGHLIDWFVLRPQIINTPAMGSSLQASDLPSSELVSNPTNGYYCNASLHTGQAVKPKQVCLCIYKHMYIQYIYIYEGGMRYVCIGFVMYLYSLLVLDK